jgi:hypothetical protein
MGEQKDGNAQGFNTVFFDRFLFCKVFFNQRSS